MRVVAVAEPNRAVGLRASARAKKVSTSAGRSAATAVALGTWAVQIFTIVSVIVSVLQLAIVIGDDLAEGKPTLPLIYAMRTGTDAQRELIREAIRDGGREQMADIIAIIEATGALDYTAGRAREAADAAIAELVDLPDNDYRSALVLLAEFAVQRRS